MQRVTYSVACSLARSEGARVTEIDGEDRSPVDAAQMIDSFEYEVSVGDQEVRYEPRKRKGKDEKPKREPAGETARILAECVRMQTATNESLIKAQKRNDEMYEQMSGFMSTQLQSFQQLQRLMAETRGQEHWASVTAREVLSFAEPFRDDAGVILAVLARKYLAEAATALGEDSGPQPKPVQVRVKP